MAWQLELQKYHINTCFHALAWALASESQEVSVRSLQLIGRVACAYQCLLVKAMQIYIIQHPRQVG